MKHVNYIKETTNVENDIRTNEYIKFLFICLTLLLLVCPYEGFSQESSSKKLRIRKIEISGLKRLENSELLNILKIRNGSSYTIDEIISRISDFDQDIRVIAGYPYINIKYHSLDYSSDSSYANLNIVINEGPLCLIKAIELTGALGGKKETISQFLEFKKNDRVDYLAINSSQSKIMEYFVNSGFPFAKIELDVFPEFNPDTTYSIIRFKVWPGQRVEINELSFKGNKKTKPGLMNRICKIEESAYYSHESNNYASQRLMATGWFASVDSGTVYKTGNKQYGLLYNVQEQPTSAISGVLGYAPEAEGNNNVAGSIDAKLDNIAGTGRRLDFHWQRENENRSSFGIAYAEPYFLNMPLALGASIEQESAESLYVSIQFQADITWSFEDYWKLNGNLFWKTVSEDSLYISTDELDYSLNGFGLGLIWDNRGYPDNPRSGFYFKLNSDQLFPSNLRIISRINRNSIRFDTHYPLNQLKSRQLYFSFNASEIHSNKGLPPVSEWYRIGGANSLRGYLENSLAVSKYLLTNFELRFLTGLNSRIFLFSDVAATQVRDNNDWYGSYGLGVQTSTPLGTIKIAAGIPVNQGFSATVIHSGLSTKF